MYLGFALVKNLRSSASELIFSDFTLRNIQQGDIDVLRRAQELFPGGHASYGDWIYERSYDTIADDQWERISVDTENILLLLRLYRVGDLVFLQPCTQEPGGRFLHQLPYRVMSYIPPTHRFEMGSDECSLFDEFAADIISLENWSSTWFQITRRFFLLGSSTEFNPRLTYFDRVVDYMISLEATLVPDRGFVGSRLSERAASLLTVLDMDRDDTKRILKKFYDIRSKVAHGADTIRLIDAALENADVFEKIVRMTIVEALRKTPADNACRKTFLKELYEVPDSKRTETIYKVFCDIKDQGEKNKCFAQLSKRIAEARSV
ncbi:MAG: HEPN domain-containing protein [Deltaproteobacteria bacterium]|nr:HEPN domain-containing protein [Deltaproteobacteria bacterium]